MLLTLALRSLLRNKRRTAVTLATIAVGTAALFLFRGFNTGLLNEYRNNAVRAHCGNGQVNALGYRDKVFAKPWEAWIQNPQEVLSNQRSIPGVERVFPRVEFPALVSNGTRALGARGVGIDGAAESDFFYTINIVSGSSIGDAVDGIVLGRGLAHSLELDTDKVEKISLGLARHDDWPLPRFYVCLLAKRCDRSANRNSSSEAAAPRTSFSQSKLGWGLGE